MPEHQYVLDDKGCLQTILRTSNWGATWTYATKYNKQLMWFGIDRSAVPLSVHESPLLNLEEIIECLYESNDPQFRMFIPLLVRSI